MPKKTKEDDTEEEETEDSEDNSDSDGSEGSDSDDSSDVDGSDISESEMESDSDDSDEDEEEEEKKSKKKTNNKKADTPPPAKKGGNKTITPSKNKKEKKETTPEKTQHVYLENIAPGITTKKEFDKVLKQEVKTSGHKINMDDTKPYFEAYKTGRYYKTSKKEEESCSIVEDVIMLLIGSNEDNDEQSVYFIPTNTEDKDMKKLTKLIIGEKVGSLHGFDYGLALMFYNVDPEGEFDSRDKYEKAVEKANDKLDKLLQPYFETDIIRNKKAIRITKKAFLRDYDYH